MINYVIECVEHVVRMYNNIDLVFHNRIVCFLLSSNETTRNRISTSRNYECVGCESGEVSSWRETVQLAGNGCK